MNEEEKRKRKEIIAELLTKDKAISVNIEGRWAIMTLDEDEEEKEK